MTSFGRCVELCAVSAWCGGPWGIAIHYDVVFHRGGFVAVKTPQQACFTHEKFQLIFT
jgi:hypothetical protein